MLSLNILFRLGEIKQGSDCLQIKPRNVLVKIIIVLILITIMVMMIMKQCFSIEVSKLQIFTQDLRCIKHSFPLFLFSIKILSRLNIVLVFVFSLEFETT